MSAADNTTPQVVPPAAAETDSKVCILSCSSHPPSPYIPYRRDDESHSTDTSHAPLLGITYDSNLSPLHHCILSLSCTSSHTDQLTIAPLHSAMATIHTQTIAQQTPDTVAAEAKATHTDTTESAPVPQIITPLPEPVDAPHDGTTAAPDAEEVAAVIANEKKEEEAVATAKATDATTTTPPTAVEAEGTQATEEAKAEETLKATTPAEEKSPSKSPKRSSSPFQAVKGFFGRHPSHKSGKAEVSWIRTSQGVLTPC